MTSANGSSLEINKVNTHNAPAHLKHLSSPDASNIHQKNLWKLSGKASAQIGQDESRIYGNNLIYIISI